MRENGCIKFFMTKSPRKNVPDVGIELRAACMPSGHASNPIEPPHPALPERNSILLRTYESEHDKTNKMTDLSSLGAQVI